MALIVDKKSQILGRGAMKILQKFDVIVIGGGPAGMSASMWCADLGLSSIVLEREAELGGQLLWTFNQIGNYLGVAARDGRDLRDRFLKQITGRNIQHMTSTRVSKVDLVDKIVTLEDGRCFSAQAVIIATGVRRRTLNVLGEKEFARRGILESGVKVKDQVKGKKVLIVGGGDAALENALILSENAARIYLVHRRREFTARKEFVRRLKRTRSIELFTYHTIGEIKGIDRVEAVELHDLKSGIRSDIEVDHVLIRIGVVPNTEMFLGQVKFDDAGYVQVDALGSTSIEGSYAVGDVASPIILNISNAVGQGTAAAKAIYNRLKN